MRRLLLTLTAFAAFATAWWAVGSSAPTQLPDDLPASGGATAPNQPPTTAATNAHGERTAARATDRGPDDGALPPDAEEAAGPDATSPPPTTLAVDVRDAASGARIAAFGWRFTTAREQYQGEVQDGAVAALQLPPGQRGSLLIEAPGMQPHEEADLLVPSPPSAPRSLTIRLLPAVTAEGITLLVQDLDGRPLAHVEVAAFALGQPGHDNERLDDKSWPFGQPLWTRRADSVDGRYRLPQLPAGRYGVRVAAVDAAGEALALQSFHHTYTLTGSNGFVEEAVLEPGCALRLELVAIDGSAFDPSRHRTTRLTVTRPGQDTAARQWTARAADGRLVRQLDAVPATGVIWPTDPLPPGVYTFELVTDGVLRAQQPLTLRAERQHVRVIVP